MQSAADGGRRTALLLVSVPRPDGDGGVDVLQVAVVAGRRASEVVHIELLARVRRPHLFVAAPAPAMGHAVSMVACSSLSVEPEPTAIRAAGTAATWPWWRRSCSGC